MKKTLFLIALAIVLSAAALLIGPTRSQAQENKFRHTPQAIPNQYIVVLKPETARSLVNATTESLAATYGGKVGFVYEYALKGFSIQMSEDAAIALSKDPRVDYVAEDGLVTLSGTQLNPPSWGLDRIDQRDLPLNNAYTYKPTGAGVHAYILDSGVRTTHEDFHGRASIAADFIGDGLDFCTGHGTHVAGTVGGSTYGVAKGVTLHSVRVFGCASTSPTSVIVAGVNWITIHHINPAVVNMSINSVGGTSSAIDTAVSNSINSGVTYVVAAGNEGADAGNTSPAHLAAACTVGGTDDADTRAVYTPNASSNYGSVLDIFAPSKLIVSAWIDSDTSQQTIGGTSMAAPHVTGVAAQYLQMNPGASPAAVCGAIVANATVGRVINPGPGSPNRLLYSNFLSAPPRVTYTDFDGDLKGDAAVWRPSSGVWYLLNSSNGGWSQMQWGLGSSGDQIVPGDYDGDRKADLAFWRPSTSTWYIVNSSDGSQRTEYWGLSGDVTVPADYDGDTKTDVAVWRPSTGIWYIRNSSGGERYETWGLSGDKAVAADFDGDGKADLAVWRPSDSLWYILQSSTGTIRYEYWGSPGDVHVPADYDGDLSADAAVWRPSTGIWYIINSTTGTARYETWGLSTDIPAPADYDGDGKTDVAVWRPSDGVWYILQSSTGTPNYIAWGLSGDIPIPSAYNRY